MNHKHRFARQLSRSITCDTCKGGGVERVEHRRKDGTSFEYQRPCHKCRGKGITEKPY